MSDGQRPSRRFGRGAPNWGIDHLSQDAVVAFADDELSAGAHQRAAGHLADCGECAAEVIEQRQVRSALRGADEPRVPASLLSVLRSIPQDADLPGPPPGLAVTADGQLVSVLRPDRMRTDTPSPVVYGAPAGLAGTTAHVPAQSRGRRLRVGATAVSGLALGALAFGALPSAGVAPAAPAQLDRGVLGGSLLGGTTQAPGDGSSSGIRPTVGPALQPAAIRTSGTPSATPTTPAAATSRPEDAERR